MESIDVNLIELPVSVTDAGGLAITGLTAADFTVLENGKPQKVSHFNFAENLPISAGLLIDHSGSMEKRMEETKAAAIEFFREIMKKDDRAFVAAFASDPARAAPFVSSLQTLEAQVNAIPDAKGSTALYDAIVTGLYRFRNVQGRKALIVLSDGADTSSRLDYDDMLTYARSSRVPLYFIGIGFGFGDRGGMGTMRNLAAETGGAAYFVRSSKDLGDAYSRLERDLRSQYLLGYEIETSSKDQDYRTVEVRVSRPDAKVRTIRGYIP
jgi:VWFA-related protein